MERNIHVCHVIMIVIDLTTTVSEEIVVDLIQKIHPKIYLTLCAVFDQAVQLRFDS